MDANGRRIVLTASALVAVGLLTIYAASAYITTARFNDPSWFFRKQLLWVGVAGIAGALTSMVPYAAWGRWKWPILALTLGGLFLVLVPGVGSRFNGASRWIRFGSFGIQPSEFAKLGMIVVLAAFLADRGAGARRFAGGFLPAFAMTGMACALILVEPDVGTAVFLAGSLFALMLAAGVRWLHLVPAVVAMVALAVPAMIASGRFDHVRRRLEASSFGRWLTPAGTATAGPVRPGEEYQAAQSRIAVGDGGLTGTRAGAGIAAMGYVPEVHSDFIFAAIAEQFGLAGSLTVLALFVVYLLSGYGLMTRAPDRFGALLAFGLTFTVAAQAVFNMAVVTGVAPTKGISLPFVSFGGSGMVAAAAGVGILVNLSQTIQARESVGECESARVAETAGAPASTPAGPTVSA